jgi:hypothetical protein
MRRLTLRPQLPHQTLTTFCRVLAELWRNISYHLYLIGSESHNRHPAFKGPLGDDDARIAATDQRRLSGHSTHLGQYRQRLILFYASRDQQDHQMWILVVQRFQGLLCGLTSGLRRIIQLAKTCTDSGCHNTSPFLIFYDCFVSSQKIGDYESAVQYIIVAIYTPCRQVIRQCCMALCQRSIASQGSPMMPTTTVLL